MTFCHVVNTLDEALEHVREDVHATHQLHCQSWAGQCHAKHAENAAHAILIGVILNDLERFCVTCKFFLDSPMRSGER